MPWAQANRDLLVTLTFVEPAGKTPIQPDPGSVVLSVYANDGTPLAGFDAVAQPNPAGTSIDVLVPGASNAIASGLTLENRFIEVLYRYQGNPQQLQYNYSLSQRIPMTVTSDDVRGLLGVTVDELPDSDINLLEAYYTLNIGADILPYLTGGTAKALTANRIIALNAAILLAPSLPQRLLQSQKSEDSSASRFSNAHGYKLVETLYQEFNASIQDLLSDVITFTTPTLFAVTVPTDRVTGQ